MGSLKFEFRLGGLGQSEQHEEDGTKESRRATLTGVGEIQRRS
jgi:hypothetical protein